MKDTYLTGTLAGAGSFRCRDCGYGVALDSLEQVPDCPNCGSDAFVRASLFDLAPQSSEPEMLEHEDSEWIAAVRKELDRPGLYFACREEDRVSIIPVARKWTRIGRSLAADLRFDDPTVSRRHALVVSRDDGVQVLDDRSLNGVFHNGRRVDSAQLEDGDELVVGRYRLHFLDTTGATSPKDAGALEALA